MCRRRRAFRCTRLPEPLQRAARTPRRASPQGGLYRTVMWEPGFGIWDSGFGIRDLGFGIWDSRIGDSGIGDSKTLRCCKNCNPAQGGFEIIPITATFPSSERFGLSAQMRKAAVSIPSNISEGHRHRGPSYIHHVVIALGSHAELETQALLGHRLTF